MDRFLNYGRHQVDNTDIDAVLQVLRSELITQGPVVERFEAAIAERVGAKYGIAVNSGTAGLHIACLAAEMDQGSTGITSAITFAASANAMIYCGAQAKFSDIDASTISMSSNTLGQAIEANPESKLVMPVHFAGLATNAEEIKNISDGRVIVEDAAHAIGGTHETGLPVGNCKFADMVVFSFHPVKPITSGEGGMVLTDDPELSRRLRLLRNHGIEKSADLFINQAQAFPDGDEVAQWYQEQQLPGLNYRMSDIHAALGLSQLAKLDKFIGRRREIAERYDHAFAKIESIVPYHSTRDQRKRSALHLYILNINFKALKTTRTKFMARLYEKGIGSQVHYLPVYQHPFHQELQKNSVPIQINAEEYYQTALSIPLFQSLQDEEVEKVIREIIEITHG
jgi:perosamine synthetase